MPNDMAILVIDGIKLTIKFHETDGPPKTCYYCGQPGLEQRVVIDAVKEGTNNISPDGAVFQLAKERLERQLLHGRGLCQMGSVCEKKLIDEQCAPSDITWT